MYAYILDLDDLKGNAGGKLTVTADKMFHTTKTILEKFTFKIHQDTFPRS